MLESRVQRTKSSADSNDRGGRFESRQEMAETAGPEPAASAVRALRESVLQQPTRTQGLPKHPQAVQYIRFVSWIVG